MIFDFDDSIFVVITLAENKSFALTNCHQNRFLSATKTFGLDWDRCVSCFYQENGLFLSPQSVFSFGDDLSFDKNLSLDSAVLSALYANGIKVVHFPLDLNKQQILESSYFVSGLTGDSLLLDNGGFAISVNVAYSVDSRVFYRFVLSCCVLPEFVEILTKQEYLERYQKHEIN